MHQRYKATYDLPCDVTTPVTNLARQLDVSSSDVMTYLVRQALASLDLKAVTALRMPIDHPCRFGFTLKAVRQPTKAQEGLQRVNKGPSVENDLELSTHGNPTLARQTRDETRGR